MSSSDSGERVVVVGTGVAAPTPRGLSVDGFWRDLRQNKHGFRPIPEIVSGYEQDIETRYGALLPDLDVNQLLLAEGFDVKDPINIYKEARARWDKSTAVAVWSGAQAMRQSGLLAGNSLRVDEAQIDPKRFGIYEGSGFAGSGTLLDIQSFLDRNKLGGDPNLRETDYAFSMLKLLGGRGDEVLAKIFKAQAFNDTMYTECAAGLSSVDRAMDDLRMGRADVVLAGGLETAANPSTIWAFEALRAVNTTGKPSNSPRPFSRNPGGLMIGEGAGNVVLETLEHANWRRQKLGAEVVILAEVLGTGKSSDAFHDSFPSDEGPGRAMDMAIANAGYEAEQLTNLYIQAHATATSGDLEEFNNIAARLRKEQVLGISSIKGNTGHTFGAAGTLGLITGILALRDGELPPNRNLRYPLPETEGWEMLPAKAKKVSRVDFVLVNAFGFGGKNRVVLLGPGNGLEKLA